MADAVRHVPGRVKFLVCVDGSPESRVAARFGALRAKNTKGYLVLLTVIEPVEFQHWVAIEEVMEAERREEAERMLEDMAAEMNEMAGVTSAFVVREGRIGEEILATVEEDPSIDFVVLGATAAAAKRGRLTSWLSSQVGVRLWVPLVIVPGNLTDEQLVNLT